MRAIRKTTHLALLGALLGAPLPAAAQTVQGHSLAGNWVRIDSNNDPNDLMRVSIDPSGAVLTSVPAAASPYWSVGDVLWRAIQPNGALEVRGSDGNYYPSTITFQGPDLIDLDIQHTGAGFQQTWQRAGPTIDGDWEQIAPAGDPSDGTQIRAQAAQATIRYMPASAPRGYRIGRQLWQNVGAGGAMQVLGSDGRYHPAQVTLVGTDTLLVDSNSPRVTNGQIWVRPGIVAAARAAPRPPPANPNQPGSGLQPINPPPALPPPASAPPPSSACLATSLTHDAMGQTWGWDLTTPNRNDAQAVGIGVGRYWTTNFLSSARLPTDLDRLLLPAFGGGFSYVWKPEDRRRVPFEVHTDLTASQYDQRDQAARAAGLRATDFEAYETSAGMRYGGVWSQNPEGLGWRVDYDQTSQQFGQAFPNLRNNGYRLVDIEAYETPNGIRYAGIWYRSCDNTNWREWRDMNRTGYQARVDSMAALGFRVVDYESYETSSGQRYAAIWEEMPAGRGWAVRTDRTLKWFLNYHQQYEDEGMRLVDFESYDTPNGLRYAGVWAENDRRYDFALGPLIDSAIDDPNNGYRVTHGIPGISVAVMQGDEVIYRRGFGWADSAQEKQAFSGTIYMTASIAKVIGATAAARLHEQGRIDLSDTTANILDYIGSNHRHTVRQLLGKVGCIRHYDTLFADPDQRWVNGNLVSDPTWYQWRDSAVRRIQAPLLPNCRPGRHWLYSTHGFTFVGAVLEEELGETIGQIIFKEITGPASLTSMKLLGTFPTSGSSGPVQYYELAQPYFFNVNATQTQTTSYEDTSWKVLGGGFQTDALDLARFGHLTANGTIVSPGTRDTLLWMSQTGSSVQWADTTQMARGVGLAWRVRRQSTSDGAGGSINRRIAQHGGDGRGGASDLMVFRDAGMVIAILTNQQQSSSRSVVPPARSRGHPIETLTATIADIVFDNPPPPP